MAFPAFRSSGPALATLGFAGAVVVLAALMPEIASPYGDTELTAAIDQDDRQVCTELGLRGGSAFAHCTARLLDLRRRHEQLVSDASWP